MSTDQEWKRLQDLYANMGDGELTSLFERKADLTEVAQQAITTEFRRRKLTLEEEEPVSSSYNCAGGVVYLWRFGIASEANDALALLENHAISAEMKPVPWDSARSLGDPAWELYVTEAEKHRAIELLRRKKGLFPLAEFVAQHDDITGNEDLFVVAEFDQAEDVAIATHALQGDGIAFRISEEQDGAQTIWKFEVAQDDLDRAGEAMERAMRESPEGDGA